MRFEQNRGQLGSEVFFQARGLGYDLQLAAGEATLTFRSRGLATARSGAFGSAPRRRIPAAENSAISTWQLRMKIVAGDRQARVQGEEPLPTQSHYMSGKDPSRWVTHVPNFQKVRYLEIYPGIDLFYYGNQQQLEYDFVVAPGRDPRRIALAFEGQTGIEIGAQGELLIHAARGAVSFRKPRAYQQQEGRQREIPVEFEVSGTSQIQFKIGDYDPSRPLVIDPVVSFSTYLGGGLTDGLYALAVDPAGNSYVAGYTNSMNPAGTCGTAPDTRPCDDVYVVKLNSAGTAPVYTAVFGGSNDDRALDIAIDSSGNAYLAGKTSSADFPVTAGAYQRAYNGGDWDAFVVKLRPDGTVSYATYLGGSGSDSDYETRIAIDTGGKAYVAGDTSSLNFPTTPGAFQRQNQGRIDGFVSRLNATGTELDWSTYFGGNSDDYIHALALKPGVDVNGNSSGNPVIAGETFSTNLLPATGTGFQKANRGKFDAFVAEIAAGGQSLNPSTYLGGLGDDAAFGLFLDAAGHPYVTGVTFSSAFPTTAGAFQTIYFLGGDIFVTKLSNTYDRLEYSTYIGGVSGLDQAFGIAVDLSGNAVIVGSTDMVNYPVRSPLQGFDGQTCGQNNCSDAVVTRLNSTGSGILFSTYLGGRGGNDTAYGVAMNAAGNTYVVGQTESSTFPATPGSYRSAPNGGRDGFLIKLADLQPPATTYANLQFWFSPNPAIPSPTPQDTRFPYGIFITETNGVGVALTGLKIGGTASDLAGLLHVSRIDAGATVSASLATTFQSLLVSPIEILFELTGNDDNGHSNLAWQGQLRYIPSATPPYAQVEIRFDGNPAIPAADGIYRFNLGLSERNNVGVTFTGLTWNGQSIDFSSLLGTTRLGSRGLLNKDLSYGAGTGASYVTWILTGNDDNGHSNLTWRGVHRLVPAPNQGTTTTTTTTTTTSTTTTISATTTTLPAGQPNILDFAQVAVGGSASSSYRAFLVLNNSSASTVAATVLFKQPNAQPLTLTISDVVGISRALSIPAKGSVRLNLTDPASAIKTGWCQVYSSNPLSGVLVYQLLANGVLLSEASVLPSLRARGFTMPVPQFGGESLTGLALAAVDSQAAQVTLRFYRPDGVVLSSSSLVLNPGEQVARFVTEFIQGLASTQEGTLEITSSGTLAAVGLLFQGSVFTTIPVGPIP